MEKSFYITTPIYYVNDIPHIGHAYTTIAADVLARFYRMRGYEVFFLTGTDEHGQKVQKAAASKGIDAQDHVDKTVVRFQDLWKRLNISNDDFIRTTEQRHKSVVKRVLGILRERGEIFKDKYEGWYCTPEERFWLKKDLKEGRCPSCGRDVEYISESNYFFRMSKYQRWLKDYIEQNPGFIQPEVRRNEIMGFLDKPLGDLCVSRPRSRLSWGIPIPFDEEYVTYVWFDALINYISALGYGEDNERYDRFWPADYHLIGKDILTTHSVYWSTVLKAADIPPPRSIFAHGWWTVEGEKMSKSLGNVIDPFKLVDDYGEDRVRYFLLREVPFGQDGDFSYRMMEQRLDSDLSNDLGNLLSRSLAMCERYFNGVIPSDGNTVEMDRRLNNRNQIHIKDMMEAMERVQFHRALMSVWNIIGEVNRYIDQTSPWVLYKDDKDRGRLKAVLYNILDNIRVLSLLLYPFMPSSAEDMWFQLGIDPPISSCIYDESLDFGMLERGIEVRRKGPLFPRIKK